MIDKIKNVSGGILDWGDFTQPDLELTRFNFRNYYDKACEFASQGFIEFYGYDELEISMSDALEWLINAIQKGVSPLIDDYHDTEMKYYDVNYDNQLLPNIKLNKVTTFGITGLNINTIGYRDPKGDNIEVFKSDIIWIVDLAEPIPAARKILERTTTRNWIDTDGNYSLQPKVTNKLYDTREKQNTAGTRMRLNLRRDAEAVIGTGIYLTDIDINGSATVDPTELMTQFLEFYEDAFATWHITGKGTLYDDILNDAEANHSWLNWVVPNNASTQALLPQMIGLTIRAYSIDKFKGLTL